MTKKEMVELLAERAEVSKSEAGRMFDETFKLLAEEIAKGGVRVDGFGSFKVNNRAARTAKNPRTGEVVNVPAKKVVAFKAAAPLKERI